MLEIRASSSMAQVLASVRNVSSYMVPYAAAAALTRTARHAASVALPDQMRTVFDRPVPFTLNALRIEPASKDKLLARVLVKDRVATGVPPEKYLFPQVEGGVRSHKRSEGALRYAGVLTSGQYAMPAAGLPLDAHGNLRGADIRSILTALKNMRGVTRKRRGGLASISARPGRKLTNDLFVGKPRGAGNRPDGIWRREGQRIRPLFVFTSAQPAYARRLDFSGVVQSVVQERFASEFNKALCALAARGGRQ